MKEPYNMSKEPWKIGSVVYWHPTFPQEFPAKIVASTYYYHAYRWGYKLALLTPFGSVNLEDINSWWGEELIYLGNIQLIL